MGVRRKVCHKHGLLFCAEVRALYRRMLPGEFGASNSTKGPRLLLTVQRAKIYDLFSEIHTPLAAMASSKLIN